MEDKLPTNIIGIVSIFEITNNERIPILIQKNSLATDWPNILKRALAGEELYHINKIRVKNSSSIDVIKPVVSVTYPAYNKVKFLTIFNQASFNGTITEAYLLSNSEESFSELTGISVTKTDQQQLGIEWVLTIN